MVVDDSLKKLSRELHGYTLSHFTSPKSVKIWL